MVKPRKMVDAGRTLTPTDQEGDGAPPVMLLRILTVHVSCLQRPKKLMVAHTYHAGALWAGSGTIIESRLEGFAGLLCLPLRRYEH